MQYTKLGRTGVTVSSLCMGTMTFGREADEATSAKVFHRCREAGINFFDCADIYADGRSEEILGKLIRDCRGELVITSKVGFPVGDDPNSGGLSRRHIMQQVEASLRRLGTDWLDVYFCHREDPATPVDETLRAMDDLVRQGKVRYLGVSNWPAWRIARTLGDTERLGLTPLHVLQPMYNLAKRTAEVELLPLARAENLGVISYSPLAGGLLTGKYSGGRGAPGDRFNVHDIYVRRYADQQNRDTAERFCAYAAEAGVSPVTLAVAWVKAHPGITAPIIGARNVEQLGPSLAAGDYEMSPEQWREISALTPPVPVATDRDEERE
jgi:aryl-alcohol dehydrogenase-like predicted oxidoreductase